MIFRCSVERDDPERWTRVCVIFRSFGNRNKKTRMKIFHVLFFSFRQLGEVEEFLPAISHKQRRAEKSTTEQRRCGGCCCCWQAEEFTLLFYNKKKLKLAESRDKAPIQPKRIEWGLSSPRRTAKHDNDEVMRNIEIRRKKNSPRQQNEKNSNCSISFFFVYFSSLLSPWQRIETFLESYALPPWR